MSNSLMITEDGLKPIHIGKVRMEYSVESFGITQNNSAVSIWCAGALQVSHPGEDHHSLL